ncbi:UNVERIFIED_CONTAM: hypothetical protein Slati_2670100 [Sesamum latifolium]|uniref:Uncharacterized protein n=1 Tax=Sesamum latifolium TaxID=2727402 RepID=A0AAW2VV95_9LAMI
MALRKGKSSEAGSSTKHPQAKSPVFTPANSASTRDPKRKHRVNHLPTSSNRVKGSTGLLAHPALKPITRDGKPRPAEVKAKKEKLSTGEARSLF